MPIKRLLLMFSFTAVLAACYGARGGASYVLDDPASSISVVFSNALLRVTNKVDGFVWANPSTGGGSALTNVQVTTANSLQVVATANGPAGANLVINCELLPATGALGVTLSGSNAPDANGIQYPYAFYAVGQSNTSFAVMPIDSGYVLPVSATGLQNAFGSLGGRRMEWFGGTDNSNQNGWIGLVETYADYTLRLHSATFETCSVVSAAPQWLGSNNNPTHTPNLLSYDRIVTYQFLTNGGYVALAKQFRSYASQQGWLKTLTAKNAEDPDHKTAKLMGAPVIYLWGDGRTNALLDALTNAGLKNALIQVSVNNYDNNKKFPNAASADTNAWASAIRDHGFVPGFYDIYLTADTNPPSANSPLYDGYYYLWPPDPLLFTWAYCLSNGQPYMDTVDNGGSGYYISPQCAAQFASTNRLPAHLAQFDIDACFFDTVCAWQPQEDYDTNYGHFATRSTDISNRLALLTTAYSNSVRRLITGTEQGKSWAVPSLHWAEGKFWEGDANGFSIALVWNDFAYPAAMVNPVDPTSSPTSSPTNFLGNLLSDGYQAPLWDLVFHDCIVTTTHWSRPHNKFLYAWDTADLWAMLRGQAPLLQMVYAGAKGQSSNPPLTLTNALDGSPWTCRWTVMSNRFIQTFTNVCAWQGQVGWMEMINHQWLSTNRSVQMSEFSTNDGVSGLGIVVNFGLFDGQYSMTNSTWTGVLRNAALSVPAGWYQTYSWSNPPPSLSISSGINGITLNFLASAQQSYTLQSATNLFGWLPLTTLANTNVTNMSLQYLDNRALNQQVYYRLTMP